MKSWLYSGLLCVAFTSIASASSVTYITPVGTLNSFGNAVDFSVTFTATTGMLTITLDDNEVNPKADNQTISGVNFTLDALATVTASQSLSGTVGSQLGSLIDVNSNKSITPVAGNPTGWELNSVLASGVYSVDAFLNQPENLIIGNPGGATYSNANGSLLNGNFNPWIQHEAIFTVLLPSITVNTKVTKVSFNIGTTLNATPLAAVNAVPEPGSFLLLSLAIPVGLYLRKKTGRAKS